jgi:hypothetical protein
VQAQQTGKVYYIAVISPNAQPSDMSEAGDDQAQARLWGAFFGELRRLGYVEGKDLVVERYSGEGRVERFRELASSSGSPPSGPYLCNRSRHAARIQSSDHDDPNRWIHERSGCPWHCSQPVPTGRQYYRF